ncbi:uncharacterized protein [Mobula birostris]|uniref:uncharacterized protein isoform X3 n=1 Tax=Mobula birostris TaxID=1983395 RepID=UPI003B28B327
MSIVVGNSSPTAAEHSLCELNGPQQLNTARGTMRFAEAPEVCGLCLFTYLSAVTAALTLRVHQDRVNGTAGHSVLLPVSYTVPDPHGYLRITWTGGGNASVCMEYTCFSGQECHLSDSRSHTTVSKPCKHRALLFPENASLLLRDLQINDSGIYELSIVHSTGTEKGNLTLEVRPATESAIDTGSGIHAGITAATDRIPVIKNEFIIPPVVFTAAVIIILCLVVKTRRVCKGSQQQKEEQHTTQDHWNSSANCPAVWYTERASQGITGTNRKKVENPEENAEYDKIWFGK